MKRPNNPFSFLRRRGRAGFTLAEIVVSMGVAMLLMDMVLQYYVENANYMYLNEQKLTINKDMRVLTGNMSDDARYANFFVMYSNYTTSARAAPTNELLQGDSGDFLVFVFYGTPVTGAAINVRPISEIVGYYREPYQSNQLYLDPITDASSSLEPVHRFDLSVANGTLPANQYLESTNVPSSGTTTTIEALLPADTATVIATHPIVVQLANGLSDGCLFHDFWGKSVMINGQIVQGSNYISASDTYNFTISPRG